MSETMKCANDDAQYLAWITDKTDRLRASMAQMGASAERIEELAQYYDEHGNFREGVDE